ncbi:MAG TPA: hypothetical protein VK118_04070 [Tetragenococcus sp.]|nr:hypothetical protein [Tetragenococcus sp.]
MICRVALYGCEKACHHAGIDSALYRAAEKSAQNKYKFIQVKTVASDYYEEYEQAIRFYQKLGFSELDFMESLSAYSQGIAKIFYL